MWTDSAYGVIEMHQQRKFGRLAGTKFTNPDWAGWRSRSAWWAAGGRGGRAVPVLRGARGGHPSVVEIPIDYRENCLLAQPGRLEQGRGRSGLDGYDDRAGAEDVRGRRLV